MFRALEASSYRTSLTAYDFFVVNGQRNFMETCNDATPCHDRRWDACKRSTARAKQFVPIFDDVSSIQQHGLGKPRQRASTPVSSDHRFTEGRLMKTLLHGPERRDNASLSAAKGVTGSHSEA